eukprot:NODE_4078_length_1939_cov_7.665011.p1 GENE.NODE_4078_length_1939_cov_7.665011~~NODE_4078_length_1939_cov_7.665011.p1  ORF type:complete len:543 (+),score=167.34 NODE_4078_length_1939_cov_7.665011:81-1709(+)
MCLAQRGVLVNPPIQICGWCGRRAAAGSGLADERGWSCRECWDQWHLRQQAESLQEQLPRLNHLLESTETPEALDAARQISCRLMGKPADTLPDAIEASDVPPFVVVTGQGFRAMREGDGTMAQWCFEQGVLMRPLDVEALHHLATFHDVAHRHDEEGLWVERVLELDPYHLNAMMMKAMLCERRGDNEGAMRVYQQAMDMGGGKQPTDRLAEIMADLKVCLEPWPGWRSIARILAEDRAWYEHFIPWHENWIHPRDNPPRSFDMDGAFGVWDYVGIEWWGKSRAGNRGQNLHYDESEGDRPWMRCTTCGRLHSEEWLDGEHNPWRPKYICLLYLTDGGGPSAFMEQIHRESAHHQPIVPQRGFFAMPRRGRLCALRGDCKHGNMAADPRETALRKIIVFDFWETHRPPPRHCTDVEFERCLGLQKLVKPPEELEAIAAMERARGGPLKCAKPVRCEVLHAPQDLPWSTRMGFWDFPVPMPTLQRLREGTGYFRMEWRAAAEAYARSDFEGKNTVLPEWPPPGLRPMPFDAESRRPAFECVD